MEKDGADSGVLLGKFEEGKSKLEEGKFFPDALLKSPFLKGKR